MTEDDVRRMALALPEAYEEDHHGIPSFRVGGKIFLTVPDASHVHVMLDAEATAAAVAEQPTCCAELHWGKRLAGVRMTLPECEPQQLVRLIRTAWQAKAPKRLLARFADET